MGFCKVSICGNITRDCELREYTGGEIASFSVAVNDRVKKDGLWVDETSYYDVKKFNAGKIAPKLVKGAHISLTGRGRINTWEKDGQKFKRFEVIADDIDVARDHEKAEQPIKPQEQQSLYDDDLPF